MHITASGSHPFAPVVDIVPPRQHPDGESVLGPSIGVWPFGHDGHGHGFHLALSVDEADELGRVLTAAAREAREMFPQS